jgi:hypothetical protein
MQPHQMTPEQFSSHPYAVFRGSTSDPRDTQNKNIRLSKSGGNAAHFGTQQAALKALNAKWHKFSENQPYLHTFWHVPKPEELTLVSDREANSPTATSNQYYTNEIEDRGSLSLALRNFNGLKSHSDFVKEAIQRGKTSEIPKETLESYTSGTLGFRPVHKEELSRVESSSKGKPIPGDKDFELPIPHEDLNKIKSHLMGNQFQ